MSRSAQVLRNERTAISAPLPNTPDITNAMPRRIMPEPSFSAAAPAVRSGYALSEKRSVTMRLAAARSTITGIIPLKPINQ